MKLWSAQESTAILLNKVDHLFKSKTPTRSSAELLVISSIALAKGVSLAYQFEGPRFNFLASRNLVLDSRDFSGRPHILMWTKFY